MKILAALLLAAAVFGQSTTPSFIDSPVSRCRQVSQLAQILASEKMAIPPEIQQAGEACGQYTALLRSRDLDKSRQALRQTEALLDQLGLTAETLYRSLSQAARGIDVMQRYYTLAYLAKDAFDLGHPEDADMYARELLQDASERSKDWNYGNATYYGNFVLGQLALAQGNVPLAGRYLLNAGNTPGSPQLNSFGPNLLLAKQLLEKGQGEIVLEFFAECKRFWKMDRGKLDEWSATIRGGGIPQITQNLSY